jgi:hypothetical protein
MARCECESYGMSINTSCANCDTPLVDYFLKFKDGTKVQVSRCTDCKGKIKSPSCCGLEMSFAI